MSVTNHKPCAPCLPSLLLRPVALPPPKPSYMYTLTHTLSLSSFSIFAAAGDDMQDLWAYHKLITRYLWLHVHVHLFIVQPDTKDPVSVAPCTCASLYSAARHKGSCADR